MDVMRVQRAFVEDSRSHGFLRARAMRSSVILVIVDNCVVPRARIPDWMSAVIPNNLPK